MANLARTGNEIVTAMPAKDGNAERNSLLLRLSTGWGLAVLAGVALFGADFLFALAGAPLTKWVICRVAPVATSAQGQVIAAAVGWFAGVFTLATFCANYRQKQTQFEEQRKQDREHFDELRKQERIENERRRLDERFKDVQDRLASDNVGERVNAVHSLIDIASTIDPSVQPSVRPSEESHRYFKPVVRRIASVLVLDESEAVRAAALASIKPLIEFSRKEYAATEILRALSWEEFRQPLTKFLIETLAGANREAHRRWFVAWVGFIATARAHDVIKAPADGPGSAEWPAVPQLNDALPYNDYEIQSTEHRKARLARLLSTRNQDGGGLKFNNELWNTVLALCPFTYGTTDGCDWNLVTDVLLDTANGSRFEAELTAREQIERTDARNGRLAAANELVIAAQTLIGTRDALAVTLVNRALGLRDEPMYSGDGKILEVDLKNTFLVGMCAVSAELAHADLRGARLDAASITEASLRNSDLRDAHLCGTSLTSADLSYSILWRADISNAFLRNATLEGTRFDGTTKINGAELPNEAFVPVREGLGNREYECRLFDDGLFVRPSIDP